MGFVVLACLCAGVINYLRNELQAREYTTQTVATADDEIFSFLLIYLLPLVTRDLGTYNWYVWFMVTALFCLILAISYGFHANPLLSILGYHFYRVTREGGMTYVLVTTRRIYRTGETLEVAKLAEYVLIEKRPPH